MTDPGLDKRVPGATSQPEEENPASPPPSGWFGEDADLREDGAESSGTPRRRGDAERAMFGRRTETEQ